ncbi:Oxidoreductases acting on the CH-OH group of donors With NAD(+) or NADP(+) as acceptor [Sarracenia purpurea var. burkii]
MVVPTYIGECGECKNCKSGKTNICLTYPLLALSGLMRDGSSRMSINGSGNGTAARQRLYHFLSCSTWSEYTVVDSHYVVKVDPRIAPPHASFISCGFAAGFGAVWKEANLQAGSTVAILGLGAVGLGVRLYIYPSTYQILPPLYFYPLYFYYN